MSWSEEYLRKEKRGTADPEGTYIWGALKSMFTLLRRGIQLQGGEVVSPYNGQLFSPLYAPIFEDNPMLRDSAMSRVLLAIGKVGGVESGRRLNFSNLGIEQLGAIYETMLMLKPMILVEDHKWVPAHGGGFGLVSEEFSRRMKLKSTENKELKTFNEFIDERRPGRKPTMKKFVLSTMGGNKRQTASYYTPPKLSEFLVRRTLKPLVEDKSVNEILDLRIVESAVGSGGHLIAAMRYMGAHLLRAKIRERHPDMRGRSEKTLRDLQVCKREIVERCLYGVDINPMSVELCRTALYLECLVEGEPLPFLHHHLKSGNSLVGAEFQSRNTVSWTKGLEFSTLFDIPIEQYKLDKTLLCSWNDYRETYGKSANSDEIKKKLKDRVQSLKSEKSRIVITDWFDWARDKQDSVDIFLKK